MLLCQSVPSPPTPSISPGNIWTPMWAELARQTANPKAVIQAGKEAQASGRSGRGALMVGFPLD